MYILYRNLTTEIFPFLKHELERTVILQTFQDIFYTANVQRLRPFIVPGRFVSLSGLKKVENCRERKLNAQERSCQRSRLVNGSERSSHDEVTPRNE